MLSPHQYLKVVVLHTCECTPTHTSLLQAWYSPQYASTIPINSACILGVAGLIQRTVHDAAWTLHSTAVSPILCTRIPCIQCPLSAAKMLVFPAIRNCLKMPKFPWNFFDRPTLRLPRLTNSGRSDYFGSHSTCAHYFNNIT